MKQLIKYLAKRTVRKTARENPTATLLFIAITIIATAGVLIEDNYPGVLLSILKWIGIIFCSGIILVILIVILVTLLRKPPTEEELEKRKKLKEIHFQIEKLNTSNLKCRKILEEKPTTIGGEVLHDLVQEQLSKNNQELESLKHELEELEGK